jgi:hypothetical protein
MLTSILFMITNEQITTTRSRWVLSNPFYNSHCLAVTWWWPGEGAETCCHLKYNTYNTSCVLTHFNLLPIWFDGRLKECGKRQGPNLSYSLITEGAEETLVQGFSWSWFRQIFCTIFKWHATEISVSLEIIIHEPNICLKGNFGKSKWNLSFLSLSYANICKSRHGRAVEFACLRKPS